MRKRPRPFAGSGMGRETGGRPVRQFVFGIATRTAVRRWLSRSRPVTDDPERNARGFSRMARGCAYRARLTTPACSVPSRAFGEPRLRGKSPPPSQNPVPAPVPARAMGGRIREVTGVGISFLGVGRNDVALSGKSKPRGIPRRTNREFARQ